MTYIIFCAKLMLMFLSTFGYCMWLCKKNINMYFTPAITIAFQVTAMFVAGLLNLLYPTAIILYVLGFVLLINGLMEWFKEKKKLKIEIPFGFFFLGVTLAVLLLALKGHSFAHYDDFSHWGLVVQDMMLTDQFPTFKSIRIGFQAYPLGSAVYIYYFAKFVEKWEAIQMYAQAFMEVCFILPIFAFAKKSRLFEFLMIIMTNIIWCMNVSVYALLVDTVLPLAGGAMFLFIYYYYSKNMERDKMFYVIIALFSIMTIQIKNSGMIFVAVVALFMVITSQRSKKHILSMIATIAAPIASTILWKKHCDYVFINAENSKHAMSLVNYWSQFVSKTENDIVTIFSNILNKITLQRQFWVLVTIWLVMYVVIYFWNKESFKKHMALIITSVITFVVYVVGIFAMYVFSMPNSIESQQLFGFERYFFTIAIFFVMLNLIPVADFIATEDNKIKRIVGIVVVIVTYCWMWVNQTGHFMMFSELKYDEASRAALETVIEENQIVKGERYAICVPYNPYISYTYMGRYSLVTNDIYELIALESMERLETLIEDEKCDYIIILDKENETLKEWININYPDYTNQVVIPIEPGESSME